MSRDLDDATLLRRFEAADLSSETFDHRAHVRVAYLLVVGHGAEAAVGLMRVGLKRILRAIAAPDEAEAIYNETVTVAWLRLVARTIEHHGAAADSGAFCDANPHLCQSSLLRVFYTKDRVRSDESRARFVPPDVPGLG